MFANTIIEKLYLPCQYELAFSLKKETSCFFVPTIHHETFLIFKYPAMGS